MVEYMFRNFNGLKVVAFTHPICHSIIGGSLIGFSREGAIILCGIFNAWTFLSSLLINSMREKKVAGACDSFGAKHDTVSSSLPFHISFPSLVSKFPNILQYFLSKAKVY